MPSKTVSVRLKPETLTKLDGMAEAMQRPRGWLMAHAIERYVETEAWQVAAIQQAVDELEQRQADLVSHDEVAQWLESWGTDHETEPPACA
jgi:predicted transcriptional regulator